MLLCGRGVMQVYADEESTTLVTSVSEGDADTIPVLNRRLVFSRDEELLLLCSAASERYRVGDWLPVFRPGDGGALTR